jgi:hypothetical protein
MVVKITITIAKKSQLEAKFVFLRPLSQQIMITIAARNSNYQSLLCE